MELVAVIVAVITLAAVIFLQTSPPNAANNLRRWIRNTSTFFGRRRSKDISASSSAKEVVSTDARSPQSGAEFSAGALTHAPKKSPRGPEIGLRQGDKCPRCCDGVVSFDQWGPGPAGSFTAYYRCSKCQAVLASDKEFDGGLI
jgi:hypothetical protein